MSSRLGGQSWALTRGCWLAVHQFLPEAALPTRPGAVHSLAPLAHSSPLS